ncbi:Lead, cadmium, zinc and mercury transporting ATPase; Copper-translocating P-type ATPase [hydrothermal vent metagenome]|uniref:Lead, cadmium, zinc and mercury transporting ATPase Copper-translocating P-type ATPase n=1 Tax=hydrothermal vent metagenome TaxID=652676 RepID=A0A3B0TZ25_9ZZZZ
MANQLTLQVEGMDCASCTSKIEGAVCALDGVDNVSVNYTSQKLKLEFDEKTTSAADVSKVVERLGYKVSTPGEKPGPADQHWWQTAKGRLVIASGGLLALAWVLAFTLPQYAFYAFSAAALLALVPFARKSVLSTIAGKPFTIETLVTIAVIGAIFIEQSAEAAVVVFLFSIGEMLEMLAAAKARKSVQALANLVPKTAFLIVDGDNMATEVAADSLAIGDIVEVRPGGRVPADGIIVRGNSAIDEASVTGESIPKRKGVGDSVFAGSINAEGVIRLKVEKAAENNMISRILQMVEDAQASKAPTARFIEKFSNYYTPGVIVFSTLIAVLPPLFFGGEWGEWTYKGLAILLIGCPCALVLSTPAAITSGISSGARQGLLMKGGAVLEAIGKVTRIAFDKTGTLTKGKPKVTDIKVFSGTKQEMLKMAGAVEASSSHPLAVAIVEEAKNLDITIPEASDSEALSGRGVRAKVTGKTISVASPRFGAEMVAFSTEQNEIIAALEEEGKTIAVVIADDTLLGVMALRDELRDGAIKAMRDISDLGVSAVMLTGDNKRTGSALAKQLGIEVEAELLPEDKLVAIAKFKTDGPVAMVGDGINDAPALASADIGIAMGGGTDVALETADAALLHEKISDVPALIKLSRATMTNIHQNITIALGLKAVFLVTTILGATTLWMAILADTGATVLVTINALRLLGYRPKF